MKEFNDVDMFVMTNSDGAPLTPTLAYSESICRMLFRKGIQNHVMTDQDMHDNGYRLLSVKVSIIPK